VVDPWAAHHYAILFVAGGGFREPVAIGEFFPVFPPSDFQFRFEWDSFDVIGCEYPEPLPDSSELYFCGEGTVTLSDSIISGTLQGNASIYKDGGHADRRICFGSHRVTFVRHPR
jgi:hypothetical protein